MEVSKDISQMSTQEVYAYAMGASEARRKQLESDRLHIPLQFDELVVLSDMPQEVYPQKSMYFDGFKLVVNNNTSEATR